MSGSVVECISEIQSGPVGVDRQGDDALYMLANSNVSNGYGITCHFMPIVALLAGKGASSCKV